MAALVNRPHAHGDFEGMAHGLPHYLTTRLDLIEHVTPVRERRILTKALTHCLPHVLGAPQIPQQLGPEPSRNRLRVVQESAG